MFAPLPGAVNVSGTVQYEKTIYSRPPANVPEAVAYAPLAGAAIRAYDPVGNLAATAETDKNGFYTLRADASAVRVEVASSSAYVAVGSGFSSGNTTGLYSLEVTPLTGSALGRDLIILRSSNAGAFNIFTQLTRGRGWLLERGYGLDSGIRAVWPSSSTQFVPGEGKLYIQLQHRDGDPDEFDDDIILHEFGHLFAELFSTDHSEGGSHSITGTLDLRLSWSEGFAHWFSSAVRSDPVHVDSTGSVNSTGASLVSSFDISKPAAQALGAGNEWAVAHVLWKARESFGEAGVLAAAARFRTVPAALQGDPVTLDSFHDVFPVVSPGADLSAVYLDRRMSYSLDALEPAVPPVTVAVSANLPYTRDALTFFPANDRDSFRFSALKGETYDIETGKTGNGALTELRVYLGEGGPLIASNAQRFGASSDTTSYVFLSAGVDGDYFVEVLRFTSATRNYGPDGGSYTRTAGHYGSYAVAVSRAPTASADPSRSAIPGFKPELPALRQSSTADGDKGRCWLQSFP